jgi:hypothetical protein
MRSARLDRPLVVVGTWVLLVSAALIGLPSTSAALAAPAMRTQLLTAASTSSTAGVLSCLRQREVEPTNDVVKCANANASWTSVTWSGWGAKTATGKGDLLQNDCAPSCPKGHFRSYPATVVLAAVRATKFGRLYSKVSFTYKLRGKRIHEDFGLLGAVHSSVSTVHEITFFAGRAGVACQILASEQVICGRGKPGFAYLSTTGKFTKCATCVGDIGEHTRRSPTARPQRLDRSAACRIRTASFAQSPAARDL